MGFSYIGLIIVIVLLLPNIAFYFLRAKKDSVLNREQSRWFLFCEHGGRMAAIILLLLGKDFFANAEGVFWLILMILCFAIYYLLWLRWYRRGRREDLLFAPLGILPVPMAVMPVFGLAFAAMWGNYFYLLLAVIIFAIGHLKNSWDNFRFAEETLNSETEKE